MVDVSDILALPIPMSYEDEANVVKIDKIDEGDYNNYKIVFFDEDAVKRSVSVSRAIFVKIHAILEKGGIAHIGKKSKSDKFLPRAITTVETKAKK